MLWSSSLRCKKASNSVVSLEDRFAWYHAARDCPEGASWLLRTFRVSGVCVLGCREAGKMVCATLLSGLQGLQVHWPLLCLVIFRSLQLGFSCPLLLYPTTLYTPTWKLVLGCSRAGTGWRGPARPVCHIFRDLLQPCKFFFGIQIVLACSVHKDKHAQVRKLHQRWKEESKKFPDQTPGPETALVVVDLS